MKFMLKYRCVSECHVLSRFGFMFSVLCWTLVFGGDFEWEREYGKEVHWTQSTLNLKGINPICKHKFISIRNLFYDFCSRHIPKVVNWIIFHMVNQPCYEIRRMVFPFSLLWIMQCCEKKRQSKLYICNLGAISHVIEGSTNKYTSNSWGCSEILSGNYCFSFFYWVMEMSYYWNIIEQFKLRKLT